MSTILVLGGTAEAVVLARNLAESCTADVIYSLAGVTRSPNLPDCAVRRGGFGGINGLVAYLAEHDVSAVVDATHPFAARMAANARAAAARAGVPLIKFLRPEWAEPPEAPWLHAATPADAAEMIRGRFCRVFLSSGLGDVAVFAPLSDIWFLVRSVDPSGAPAVLARHHHVIDRGPFDLASETALLREWHVDALVTKNSGGAATRAKLDAARALDLPVVMIDRPAPPTGTVHCDISSALDAVGSFLR